MTTKDLLTTIVDKLGLTPEQKQEVLNFIAQDDEAVLSVELIEEILGVKFDELNETTRELYSKSLELAQIELDSLEKETDQITQDTEEDLNKIVSD